MTLIIPKHLAQEDIRAERNALVSHFNDEMEKVINKNKEKDKFWILGKVRFPPEFYGKVARVFLDASDEKPILVKESFVYEVDNKSGTKELLWVCDRDGLKIIPTKQTIPF